MENVYNIEYMANRRSTPAKKKSTSARKKSTRKNKMPEHELPGGFWRQMKAILMLVLAVILIFGWLGDGGPVLNTINDFMYQAIGYAEYTFPVLLVWLAVKILQSENNRLPGAMWLSSFLMIFWIAGIAGIPSIGAEEATGGTVGAWMNEVATQILDPSVVIVIYVALIFVTGTFILQTNPVTVFKAIAAMFGTTEKDEEDAKNTKKAPARVKKELKADEDEKELKINMGAVEGEGEKAKPKLGARLSRRGLKDLKVHAMKPTPDVAAEKVAASAAETAAPSEPQALISATDENWKLPSLSILSKKQSSADPGDCKQNAHIIQETLADFGVNVEMEGANVGPRITQYTMRPPSGVSLTKITSHDKELALNLAVDGQIRIEAPIPGTRLVGVEVPNARAASVGLRGILESKEWTNAKSPLSFVVGKDISGKGVVADLAKMPHLLVAGTTGSGKSVMSNALIMSLLYRNSPSDLKLIMIDPKQVEMAPYEDIPHLLTPVITTVEKSLSAMNWAVNEMERRYSLFAKERVKKIDDYNAKMANAAKKIAVTDADSEGEDKEKKPDAGGKMPYIVVIIDEMADLMMQAGKDLEMPIVRIAQKGRAAGVHLVLATQSPKVQVITGLIKSNVPSRIVCKVTNFTESSVALGMSGAEKLLGMGDMIMLTTEMGGKPRRVQSAYVDDKEIAAVADFLRAQRGPDYNKEVIAQPVSVKGVGPAAGGAIGDLGRRYNPNDPIVRRAIEITLKNGKFSTASLQTWLGKGHGFVSGLAIWLEEIGVIGPANGHKPREVLISSMEEFEQLTSAGGEDTQV